MKKKILIIIMMFVFLLGLNGCKKVKNYYSYANDYVDEDYINDFTPSTTIIIRDEELFNTIFINYNSKINFDKNMVVLHIFSDCYPKSRKYKITKTTIKNNKLTIKYKMKKSIFEYGIHDACQGYSRCFMVIMKKMDIDEAEFIKVR